MTAQDVGARLAVVSLPKVGPARAAWLLSTVEAPQVVEALRRGRLPPDLGPAPAGVDRALVEKWTAALRNTSIDQLLSAHRSEGIELLDPSDARWPFSDEPEPPVLLFYRGDLSVLDAPVAVAIVGTRRCTTVGRTVAYEMGADIAEAGGVVVSGLALGIDAAAHRGALDRAPDNRGAAIAVVGSGLDVVYPGGNRALWEQVGTTGLLLSEAPAGAKPQRWRFPARNRLIASLSEGVVIIESHGRGGALLTVDEAIDRGRQVFSVPGSVLSPASDGTNGLLVDGAIPVRHAADVLGHLGQSPRLAVSRVIEQPKGAVRSELAAMILAEVSTGPTHVDRLLLAAAATPVEVLAEVQSLVAEGLIVLDGSTVSRR